MSKFKPHIEVLPPAQRELWPNLGWTTVWGFVLYGGTAIALRFGHRASIDFDFFTHLPLRQATILKKLQECGIANDVVQDEMNSLTVRTEPGVRLSFFGGLGMGRVGVPTLTDDEVIVVASQLDLLATKLKVILQRAEAKDYTDIAQLLRGGTSLIQGLGAARSLYGSAFSPAECLRALTFFGDGDLARVSAPTRDLLRVEAVQAAKIFPIPSIEKASNELSDVGVARKTHHDRGELKL